MSAVTRTTLPDMYLQFILALGIYMRDAVVLHGGARMMRTAGYAMDCVMVGVKPHLYQFLKDNYYEHRDDGNGEYIRYSEAISVQVVESIEYDIVSGVACQRIR